MRQQVKKQKPDGKVTIYRYQHAELENALLEEHQVIMEEISINLAKDLAKLDKPEAEKKEDHYSDPIYSAYRKMGITAKKELQIEIESHSIISDKIEADREIKDLGKELHEKQNELRLKNRELEKENNTLLKKETRYNKIRWFLGGVILVDTFLSAAALQAMKYSLLVSYIVGLGIGFGIFLLSEHSPEIINKGRTLLEKRMIAIGSFLLLGVIFYMLGIFRTFGITGEDTANTEGIRPIYFVCLNMFFVITTTLVSYFNKLTKSERQKLDQWKLKKEATQELNKDINNIKSKIQSIRKKHTEAELARKQLLIYARDIQVLIQSYYEQSLKTFYSTNLIHRSDGKTPVCFSNEIPILPIFYNDLKL